MVSIFIALCQHVKIVYVIVCSPG